MQAMHNYFGHGSPAPLPLPLRSEDQIIATWQNPGNPVVSICCATYNHAIYLKDALHGFLSQETNFPFEIVVRDDASTDGTGEIIRDYVSRYPHIVRAVSETENQFSRGVRPLHVWPSLAKGEFVALCEGDDYWIHSEKLQKQVELLRSYPYAVMSVANTLAYRQEGGQLHFVRTWGAHDKVLQGFEEVKCHYFHTSTLVIRRMILSEVVTKYFDGQSIFGDTALQAILVSYGPFALFPEFVSIYRETGHGIWSSLNRSAQLQGEINVSKKLARLLSGKYRKHQEGKLCALYRLKFLEAKKNGHATEWISLLPHLIKCGVLEISSSAKRFLKRRLGLIRRNS
ncbi:MAG: glycosyltransferase [Pseudomonadota bacterium]